MMFVCMLFYVTSARLAFYLWVSLVLYVTLNNNMAIASISLKKNICLLTGCYTLRRIGVALLTISPKRYAKIGDNYM